MQRSFNVNFPCIDIDLEHLTSNEFLEDSELYEKPVDESIINEVRKVKDACKYLSLMCTETNSAIFDAFLNRPNLTYGQVVEFSEMCRKSVPYIVDANEWEASIGNNVENLFKAFKKYKETIQSLEIATSECLPPKEN